MEQQFYAVDKAILVIYFISVILFGMYFRKRSNTSDGFMIASGRLPGWAVGLSMLGTFVSSITFLAYPGQAYNLNWDTMMFSFTLPLAAIVAVHYFIPLYREKVKILLTIIQYYHILTFYYLYSTIFHSLTEH